MTPMTPRGIGGMNDFTIKKQLQLFEFKSYHIPIKNSSVYVDSVLDRVYGDKELLQKGGKYFQLHNISKIIIDFPNPTPTPKEDKDEAVGVGMKDFLQNWFVDLVHELRKKILVGTIRLGPKSFSGLNCCEVFFPPNPISMCFSPSDATFYECSDVILHFYGDWKNVIKLIKEATKESCGNRFAGASGYTLYFNDIRVVSAKKELTPQECKIALDAIDTFDKYQIENTDQGNIETIQFDKVPSSGSLDYIVEANRFLELKSLAKDTIETIEIHEFRINDSENREFNRLASEELSDREGRVFECKPFEISQYDDYYKTTSVLGNELQGCEQQNALKPLIQKRHDPIMSMRNALKFGWKIYIPDGFKLNRTETRCVTIGQYGTLKSIELRVLWRVMEEPPWQTHQQENINSTIIQRLFHTWLSNCGFGIFRSTLDAYDPNKIINIDELKVSIFLALSNSCNNRYPSPLGISNSAVFDNIIIEDVEIINLTVGPLVTQPMLDISFSDFRDIDALYTFESFDDDKILALVARYKLKSFNTDITNVLRSSTNMKNEVIARIDELDVTLRKTYEHLRRGLQRDWEFNEDKYNEIQVNLDHHIRNKFELISLLFKLSNDEARVGVLKYKTYIEKTNDIIFDYAPINPAVSSSFGGEICNSLFQIVPKLPDLLTPIFDVLLPILCFALLLIRYYVGIVILPGNPIIDPPGAVVHVFRRNADQTGPIHSLDSIVSQLHTNKRYAFFSEKDYLDCFNCDTSLDLLLFKIFMKSRDELHIYDQLPYDWNISTNIEALTKKLGEDIRYLRSQSCPELSNFIDMIKVEYQIDNFILLITGTFHERDMNELIPRLHPIGLFDKHMMVRLFDFCKKLKRDTFISKEHQEDNLYETFLSDTLFGKYFRMFLIEAAKMKLIWDEMGTELCINYLHRFWLEDFFEQCKDLGEKGDMMCHLLSIKADIRSILIRINSFGTGLSDETINNMYPTVGYLYPNGLLKLNRATDIAEVNVAVSSFQTYQDIFSESVINGETSLEYNIDGFERKNCEFAFKTQGNFSPFYAYVKLKMLEIRNITWILECIHQNQREHKQQIHYPVVR